MTHCELNRAFSFRSGSDKENSDKEATKESEEQSSSSESESEESDDESGDEAAQTQSDAEEADVGLRSLLEDPSGEQLLENKVSYQSFLHTKYFISFAFFATNFEWTLGLFLVKLCCTFCL